MQYKKHAIYLSLIFLLFSISFCLHSTIYYFAIFIHTGKPRSKGQRKNLNRESNCNKVNCFKLYCLTKILNENPLNRGLPVVRSQLSNIIPLQYYELHMKRVRYPGEIISCDTPYFVCKKQFISNMKGAEVAIFHTSICTFFAQVCK